MKCSLGGVGLQEVRLSTIVRPYRSCMQVLSANNLKQVLSFKRAMRGLLSMTVIDWCEYTLVFLLYNVPR